MDILHSAFYFWQNELLKMVAKAYKLLAFNSSIINTCFLLPGAAWSLPESIAVVIVQGRFTPPDK